LTELFSSLLAVSIRKLERGHDLETLVYTRDRGREVMVISLVDGNISSQYSRSGIASAVDTLKARPDEHTDERLARSTGPKSVSVAIPLTAEPRKPLAQGSNKTLPEVPSAANPRGTTAVQANPGTCGEYRDGKLTIKPCSQIPLSLSEWLAKGSGATPTETAPAGNRH